MIVMCDTLVALPSATASGATILAKNSDREPDEAQAISIVPRRICHEQYCTATFISLPQVAETYACILSRPFQMWGAEMGVNEWGVAIGNEAVFTRVRILRNNTGLTGMDLLRLALERSKTAWEALLNIIQLLETYGQDACGGYRNKRFYYHNSFLIADAQNAYVLETVDRHWAYRRVDACYAISNRLSIGTDADALSSGAAAFARAKGWWSGAQPLHFSHAFSDWLYTGLGRGKARQACTYNWLIANQGKLTAAHFFDVLATHHLPHPQFKPAKATTADICMHATGLLNPNSTTGSMVAHISSASPPVVWLTGTPHPCMSVFVPFVFGAEIPADWLTPTAQPDHSLWWQAKRLQDWVAKDYPKRHAWLEETRADLQHHIWQQYQQTPADQLAQLTYETLLAVRQWLAKCLSQSTCQIYAQAQ
ncbi:MAG: C69 family dipeptidase [Cytophagales bacterium]|nr:C69 family dipeptidase [Bernardetiaceae bacterium]MDW8204298.1 C69 family dipeptidase [Cytophagales bacterium]